jgi:hypothetical protein
MPTQQDQQKDRKWENSLRQHQRYKQLSKPERTLYNELLDSLDISTSTQSA